MNVLGIGETVIDKSIILAEHLNEGCKINAHKELMSIGGPVPVALILLSRLGAHCTLVTTLGKDAEATFIQKTLKKEKITIVQKNANKTRINTVLTSCQNGTRTIIKSTVTHKKIKSVNKSLVANADIILLDRHEPLIFDQVLKYKKKQAKIIIDPSTENSQYTRAMISKVEFPIVPIELWQKIKTETKPSNLIITAGSDGSYIFDQNKLKHEPAYCVNIIDTLGAGDIFRGAFGYGVLKKWDLEKCVKFANLVAALQCSKAGNTTAIPSKKEILRFSKVAVQNKCKEPALITEAKNG
jgi:ribokinase